jgi:hypothetical protein
MNLPTQTQGCAGEAGAVELGGSSQAAPVNLSVGRVAFGLWQDEPSLRELYDIACASIVRIEQENDELRARVAVLEEEQRILARKYAPRLTDEELAEEVRHKYEADRVGGHEWGNI